MERMLSMLCYGYELQSKKRRKHCMYMQHRGMLRELCKCGNGIRTSDRTRQDKRTLSDADNMKCTRGG